MPSSIMATSKYNKQPCNKTTRIEKSPPQPALPGKTVGGNYLAIASETGQIVSRAGRLGASFWYLPLVDLASVVLIMR